MRIEAERIESNYNRFSDRLTAKEEDILTRFYGINKHVRHTLEEIGAMNQVTRERIRQIKDNALVKIMIKKRK